MGKAFPTRGKNPRLINFQYIRPFNFPLTSLQLPFNFMKFTSLKTNREKKLQLGVHDAEWFMQRITHETADGYTTDFRKYLKMPYRRAKYRNINEIPRLCVAGEFRRTPMGDLVMESYNGLVVLEVRELQHRHTKHGEAYHVQDRIRA